MVINSPLKKGQHVRVTILHTNREVTGVVEDLDTIFFLAGSGKIFAFLTLKSDDGKITLLPLDSISEIVLV